MNCGSEGGRTPCHERWEQLGNKNIGISIPKKGMRIFKRRYNHIAPIGNIMLSLSQGNKFAERRPDVDCRRA
jgi:hypothetical protein